VFGRRKRQAAEAVRETERLALFEQLAKRPETVCPFLGLATARAEYRDGFTGEHRCYAFGDPAPISEEQQEHVCLERGYSNCPRYLRGVLVIPSEELEALRRPQPAHLPPPPPPPKPLRPAAEGGGRRWVVVAVLALLLIAASGAGGWYLFIQNGGIAGSPSATPGTPVPSGASGTPGTSRSPRASATPIVLPSSGVLPTPGPDDTFVGYAVYVKAGLYPVFRLDASGTVTGEETAKFSRVSAAPVERVVGDGGALYWRTLIGTYTGLAYTKDRSGPFLIYAVYETSTGEARFRRLTDSQL
jgi:hypothetical protein